MKIAILDESLRRTRSAANWSRLAQACEIRVFDRPLEVPDAAAYADMVENIEAFLVGKPIRVLTADRNQSSLME